MLALIVVVQQIEGNVLSPILQSKSMNLHAAVVLLAVTLGGTLFGITGAFLAVPVTAVLAVVVRYLDEVVEARTRPAPPVDPDAGPAEDGTPTPPRRPTGPRGPSPVASPAWSGWRAGTRAYGSRRAPRVTRTWVASQGTVHPDPAEEVA